MTIGFLSHLDYNLWLFRLPVMQELIIRGHTVYAICPKGEVSEKFSDLAIIHIPYSIERSSLNPFKELLTIYRIYAAIQPLKLDLLHTFTAKPNIYGTIAGRLAKVPRIINLVEGLGSFYLENDLKSCIIRSLIEKLYSLCFQLSERVMFVNHDDPSYFVSKKIILSEKVFIINGVGINTKEWQNSHNKPLEPIVVTMIARALKHKGVHEFVQAAYLIHKDYQNVEFRYIGTPDPGNQFSVSESFFDSHPVINYLGQRNDIKEQLANSDIFVLPSYREGLPRTSIEAMSMGLPIITTNTVGCRETVEHGVNGFIVPAEDSNALVEAIVTLLKSPSKRFDMGQKSRKKAENEFDITNIVALHLKVYKIA